MPPQNHTDLGKIVQPATSSASSVGGMRLRRMASRRRWFPALGVFVEVGVGVGMSQRGRIVAQLPEVADGLTREQRLMLSRVARRLACGSSASTPSGPRLRVPANLCSPAQLCPRTVRRSERSIRERLTAADQDTILGGERHVNGVRSGSAHSCFVKSAVLRSLADHRHAEQSGGRAFGIKNFVLQV
jgi:hypothetical protein